MVMITSAYELVTDIDPKSKKEIAVHRRYKIMDSKRETVSKATQNPGI